MNIIIERNISPINQSRNKLVLFLGLILIGSIILSGAVSAATPVKPIKSVVTHQSDPTISADSINTKTRVSNLNMQFNHNKRHQKVYVESPNFIINSGVSQGVCGDSDGNLYALGATGIKKYNSAGVNTLTNYNLATQSGLNHLGDGSYYNGLIYVAGQNQSATGVNVTHQSITVINATTLKFVANHDISAQNNTVSGLAIDPVNNLIYVISYFDGRYVWEYKLSDFSYVGRITLNPSLDHIQGIDYVNGNLYISTDGTYGTALNAVQQYTTNGIFIKTLIIPTKQGEIEGLYVNGTDIYLMINNGNGEIYKYILV